MTARTLAPMERRLSAILAADVVGYSALMGRDESGALNLIRRMREHLLEPMVARAHGTVVKRLGDGWLVEFASAVDAVTCAVAIQGAMAEETADLRIGIHIGDVVRADGDIYGDGVNIASRLESASAPGHIAVSDDVWRQVRASAGLDFHDNGPHTLKNIADPVRIWSWPTPLPGGPVARAGSHAKPTLSIAAVAARGEAGDMAEALQDELVAAFGRLSGLALIREETKAEFVLGTAIQARRGRWRATAVLSEGTGGRTLWSDRFEEQGADEFEIQDRLVERITGAVRIRLPRLLSARFDAVPDEEMDVESLLNRAMAFHFVPASESWDRAARALAHAIDRDEKNWMAMTMLAFNRLCTGRIFGWRGVEPSTASIVRESIGKARGIRQADHVVRYVFGSVQLYLERNLAAARVELEESLRLNPNFYHAIDVMAQIELFDGRLDRAQELASRALNCDPGYPYVHLYQRDAGQVALVAGDPVVAADFFLRADSAAPELPQNLIGLAATFGLARKAAEADAVVRRLRILVPDITLGALEPWPFRDPAQWNPIRQALETVGLPE